MLVKKIFTHYFFALSACLLCCITSNAIVITSENFSSYFGEDGYLKADVPEESVLDFQGTFSGKQYTLYINKKVTVTSTTGDALFESDSQDCMKFNITSGADYTQVSGLEFRNCDLFVIGASNVVIDNIKMTCNIRGIGGGTGFLAIHSGSDNATVKNSYFENGGTGSSIVVLGKGSKNATFEGNTFLVTGSSGNILSSNVYVGTGDNPESVTYKNNTITSELASSSIMYGITVCGQGNIIEGNTITMKGNGITNQYGGSPSNSVYRNNILLGGANMTVSKNSTAEGNHVSGTLTIGEGATVKENILDSTVNVTGKNTIISDNTITDKVTVKSNGNTITGNTITTEEEYAIYLGTTTGNTVTGNSLVGAAKAGNEAVEFTGSDATTIISENKSETAVATIAIDEECSIYAQNGTVTITGTKDNAVCNIYSIAGAKVGSAKTAQGKATFTVAVNGVYVIEVAEGGKKWSKKVVIEQ